MRMAVGSPRALGALVIAGIVPYLALDVLAQLLPPHYSPVRQVESDLAVGPYGYVMTINFALRGALSLALVAELVGVRASEAFGLGGLVERIVLGLALLWMLLVVVRLVQLESNKP